MLGLGLREFVALGILGVGVLMGFLFFDPTSTGSSSDAPATISLGIPVPTAAPVTPTPSPIPVVRLGQPGGGWLVAYYDIAPSGSETRTGEGFLGSLALDVPDRPFPDSRDDAWRFTASQSLDVAAARYAFAIESDGALRIRAGDTILIDTPDDSAKQTRTIEFDHKGGPVTLIFDLKDTGGPAFLRWID